MFSPYHRFQKALRLERLLTQLHRAGHISDELFDNYWRYHDALMHKLQSARYNLERLEEKLASTNAQDPADALADSETLLFEGNMFIDGFFYNCGSALDILAREILILFGEALADDKIYYCTARQVLATRLPRDDEILACLQDPPWEREFRDYRNTVTHELLMASTWQINMARLGNSQTYSIVIPLPDDPRATPSTRTYTHNPDALKYIGTTFKRLLRWINLLYGNIEQRARSNGSIPL